MAHDRHLLSAATDQWMLVADGALAPFEGDLDDYKQWARDYHSRGARDDNKGEAPANRRDTRRLEAAQRQRQAEARKPFEKRLAALEAELGKLSSESTAAEAWLALPESYEEANRTRMQGLLRLRGELAERIAELEDAWLWTQAQMEKALAELKN